MSIIAHRRNRLAFALAASVLFACRAKEEVQHPTSVNLVMMRPAPALPFATRDSLFTPLGQVLASSLVSPLDLQPLVTSTVPGAVRDDGLVALVDRRFATIQFFDESHSAHASVTIANESDTALSNPSDVAFTSDRRLWVLDRSRTLFAYEPTGRGYAFSGARALGHRAESLCVLHDTLVVRGRGDDERLVHSYSADGRKLADFGNAYRDPETLVRDQLSRGTMGCDAASGTVVLSFDAMPALRGYDLDGSIRWEVQVPDFSPVRTRSGADPEPFVTRDPSVPFDQVTGIRPLSAGFLLISGVRRQVSSRRELRETSWHWLLRASDGALSKLDVPASIQVIAVSPRFVLAESLGISPRVVAMARRASRVTGQ